MAARKYVCGTPNQHCSGGRVPSSARLTGSSGGQKVHQSSPEAHRCYSRYLVQVLGAEQLGGREFRLPEGNELGVKGVLVLAKKSHFGAELRPGKSGEKVSGKRFMPKNGGGVLV